MRLTVLGAQSPYPGPGGATAGYLLHTDQVNLLIDCGSGVLSQLGRYCPIEKLDALVVTHYHHDHMADVGVLQYGLMVQQTLGQRPADAPLPIYGPREERTVADQMNYKEATRFHPIDETTELVLGDLRLTFRRTDHPVLCYAVRIHWHDRVIVYSADTGPGTDWGDFLSGADLFICESTFLDRNQPKQPTGHLSVRQAAALAEANRCGELWLTHLFYAYQEDELLQEAMAYQAGICRVARSGLTWESKQ